jgi:hypothetical protein
MMPILESENINGHIVEAEQQVVTKPDIAIAHALIAVAKTLQRIDDLLFDAAAAAWREHEEQTT